MEKETKLIKKIIEDFIKKLNVDFNEIEIISGYKNNFRFVIKTNDSGILIGSEGNNIKALNHLIRQIVWKKNVLKENNLRFFVDINDYQTKNIKKIEDEAIQTAKKVATFKKDIEMSPMSSFERMLVHSILANNSDVLTESTGEGKFRRVIIKLV